MRVRVSLLAGVVTLATLLPLHGVMHAQATGITCRVTASGAPIQPLELSFPLGDEFADEDIQGIGTCISLTGDSFTATVTVRSEYLVVGTLTWLPTSCPSTSGSMASTVVSNPPNVSTANPIATEGCTYKSGDASLNAFHRAHAQVTVAGLVIDDEVSAPWFIAGVSI